MLLPRRKRRANKYQHSTRPKTSHLIQPTSESGVAAHKGRVSHRNRPIRNLCSLRGAAACGRHEARREETRPCRAGHSKGRRRGLFSRETDARRRPTELYGYDMTRLIEQEQEPQLCPVPCCWKTHCTSPCNGSKLRRDPWVLFNEKPRRSGPTPSAKKKNIAPETKTRRKN